jgi:hypothetical protein
MPHRAELDHQALEMPTTTSDSMLVLPQYFKIFYSAATMISFGHSPAHPLQA